MVILPVLPAISLISPVNPVGLILFTIFLLAAIIITILLWFLRRVWFYRDPVRVPPAGVVFQQLHGRGVRLLTMVKKGLQ